MDLIEGSVVRDHLGTKYILKSKLGEGAQGVVFNTDQDGYIVKILRNHSNDRKEWLERFGWIMRRNIPKEARIAKPITLLEDPHTGYVMKKAEGHNSLNTYIVKPEGHQLGEWYNRTTGSLKKRLEIALQLAKSYRYLHLEGICYCDVSPNNILVAPNAPSIALIDADNLTSSSLYKSNILGTPRYIAPELFQLCKQPNSITDTYSFAVVIFELLTLGHPLIGSKIADGSPEEEEEAVKGAVPYIDHPEDDSNSNDSILPREIVLTKNLRKLFERTFVDGLYNAAKRPTLLEYIKALQDALNTLVNCPNSLCQANFYNTSASQLMCPWCDEEVNDICSMQIVETMNLTDELFHDGKKKVSVLINNIIINEGTCAIYRSHIESHVLPENDSIFALVKRTGNELLIKNLSPENIMSVHKETRKSTQIEPKKIKGIVRGQENLVINKQQDLNDLKTIFEGSNLVKAVVFK